jgi:glycosyltransferase involved in cell wall biosynthesis
MRILHVLPFFLPDTLGGTETYCWALCKYLQQNGHECGVIIPNYNNPKTVQYVYEGIQVTKYSEPTQAEKDHYNGRLAPEGLSAFVDSVIKYKPDVVHFHGIYGGTGITMFHLKALKQKGFSIVYTMHLAGPTCATQTLIYKGKQLCDGIINTRRCAACLMVWKNMPSVMADVISYTSAGLHMLGVDAFRLNSRIGTALSFSYHINAIKKRLQEISRDCDKIIVLTDWYKRILIKNGIEPEKLVQISQTLPPASGDESKMKVPFLETGSLKVIFAGRISSLKGVDILLEALQGFTQQQIELSIYGQADDETYNTYCKTLSKNMPFVHWRGVLERSSILQAFSQHDLLCLPSTFSEMSPLVIQEAFAAGIPVVASRVYGNMEQVVQDVNGLLFDFKSSTHLRQVLASLIADRSIVAKLKKNITTPLPFSTTGKQYELLYNELLQIPV